MLCSSSPTEFLDDVIVINYFGVALTQKGRDMLTVHVVEEATDCPGTNKSDNIEIVEECYHA
jgi:hypothetical protein